MPKKKDYGGDPGGLIGAAIWSATKPLYKEAKRQERAARVPRKTYYVPIQKTYIKDIVFEVLPQAIRNAGTNFNARDHIGCCAADVSWLQPILLRLFEVD